MTLKVQHISESENGRVMQSNSTMDSMLDTSKPPLHLVLVDSQSEFLSLPWKCKNALVAPSLPPPSPALTWLAWLQRASSWGGRPEFCFSWQSLRNHLVSRSSKSGRLTDTFVLFPLQLVASIVFISFGVIAAFCCAIVDGVFAARHIVSIFSPGLK